jgi:septal ring-binding cell division protein DamX
VLTTIVLWGSQTITGKSKQSNAPTTASTNEKHQEHHKETTENTATTSKTGNLWSDWLPLAMERGFTTGLSSIGTYSQPIYSK